MFSQPKKLSLTKDTIRVLSSLEMSVVVGGLAPSPAQDQRNTTLSTIHCSWACDGKGMAVAAKPVTTAAILR